MLVTGHDTKSPWETIVAIQRQFIAESDPRPALERALRALIERSHSELAILVESALADAAKLGPSIHFFAESVDPKKNSSGTASRRRREQQQRALDSWAREVVESKSNGNVTPNRSSDTPDVRTDFVASKSIRTAVWLPLRDEAGELLGGVALANQAEQDAAALADDLRPICDMLAAMVQSLRRDRTRGAAEAALRESESRLRVFTDHVTDGLFLSDAEPRIIDVNRRGCESLGYTREEIVGMTPLDFDSAITEGEIQSYAARVAAGESVSFDSRHRRKDGTEFPVEVRVSPVWIDGKLHTVALICDITKRKQAEEKLRESEERLQLALVASRMGVWEWDLETDGVFWSPECYEIYGDKSFDGRGETFEKWIHADDVGPIGEIVRQTLESETFNQWEFRVTPPDGRMRWIANWAMVRRDASGKPYIMLGTARDITEQKRAEDALRQSNLLLENVVENIPLAVFVKDPQDEFRVRVWNRAAETIFGIPRAEMLGRHSHDYWPKALADSYREIDELVMNVGRMQVIEQEQSTTRSGETIFVHTRKLPLCDREGKPTLLLAICEDITARNRSAEALREAQQRLAVTLRGADVGLWDWDLVTNEVNFSDEWKRQLGYQGDEVGNVYEEWESRVHPDDKSQALANVENAIRKRTPEYRAEFRMRHKDGTWRWILARGSVIDDPAGISARLMGIHIDITERKRAEEALQASESRYRTFVDHATDAFYLQDQQGRVLDVNEQACVSLGYHRDEIVGKFPYEFDLDVTPESVNRTLARLDEGKVIAIDSRHTRKDGTSFPVEIRLKPFWINNQRFHVALVRDITERKRAERALRESESRLRTLLENLDKVAVQAYEPDGTITFWNRASELFYGYTAEQALGRDLVDLLHAESTRKVERQIMAEAMRTGKPPAADEVEVVRRDGAKITVFASRVVHPRPGRDAEFFCFDVDITDRKHAEEQLAVRQIELLHASRLSTVGQMVAEISHEIAQPLNAIGNFAAASERILAGGVDGQMETLHEYVHAILEQNQRCVTILGRLRDFSRRTPGSHQACDVRQLLHESCDLMSFELKRSRIRVAFDVPDDLPAVRCDRIQLQQLVVNLLSNARDALLEQPDSRRTIVIRAASESDSVVFEVEDAGSGLSADATIHLFDPFFTTKRHGMGIGLSICQTIVKEHGGRIDASGNRHGGATFRVRLSLARK